MSEFSRIALRRLRVDGPGRVSAEVTFKTGLNAIVGASDTGKSYIFETVDYVLGGSSIPDPNLYSEGYNQCWLEIEFTGGRLLTIRRIFGEDGADLFASSLAEAAEKTFLRKVRAGHKTGSDQSLSFELLDAIGLAGLKVPKDRFGNAQAVTYRAVAQVTMVDETRIITKASPALSGQISFETPEKAFFRLMLSKDKGGALPARLPKKEVRNANYEGQIVILEELIRERTNKLNRLVPDTVGLELRLEKVQLGVESGVAYLASSAGEISKLETARQSAFAEIERIKDRRLVINEQSKRLILLRDYYASDAARLKAVIEAGAAFESLPSGECAVCGSTPDSNAPAMIDGALETFRAACRAELEKIRILSRDLDAAMEDFHQEDKALAQDESGLAVHLRTTNDELHEKLRPQQESASANFQELQKLQTNLSKAVDIQTEIQSLQENLVAAMAGKKSKVETVASTSIDAQAAQGLCDEIEKTLRAWKYSFDGRVTFDPKKLDVVLGIQPRGTMGKGYRAITHAACTIGLMRYCRSNELPHPGFVILDSPLNPFRPKVPNPEADEPIPLDVKEAFYRDLAADDSGNQYVIIENVEPPKDLLKNIQYEQFTGNSELGRSGFFPALRPKTEPPLDLKPEA